MVHICGRPRRLTASLSLERLATRRLSHNPLITPQTRWLFLLLLPEIGVHVGFRVLRRIVLPDDILGGVMRALFFIQVLEIVGTHQFLENISLLLFVIWFFDFSVGQLVGCLIQGQLQAVVHLWRLFHILCD